MFLYNLENNISNKFWMSPSPYLNCLIVRDMTPFCRQLVCYSGNV